KIASKYGGIYASHIRNEGDREMQALDEAFRIGREANIPVEIWHLKVSGRQNWGKMRDVIAAIEGARASGLDVTADQYPYIASGTSLGATIPPKYREGGSDAFVNRLKDPQVRAASRQGLAGDDGKMENMWRGTGGPQGILVASVLDPALKHYEGQTIAQIAADEHKDPLDALLELVIAGKDHVGGVYFTMNEDDVRYAMQQQFVSVGTDAGAVNVQGPLSESKTHPRAYGSFARILGRYVRDQHLLTLEQAIRKFTSLPAQRLGLRDRGILQTLEQAIRKFTSLPAQRLGLLDRGILRPSAFADITIFDPATVNDTATFEDPHRASIGIEYVFVNGVLSLEHGKVTGQLGGRPLRGPGYKASQDKIPCSTARRGDDLGGSCWSPIGFRHPIHVDSGPTTITGSSN